MAASMYLPSNRQYHWNIIYDNSDPEGLSHDFVQFLVQKLEDCYGTKCFYYDRDALAGKSVFSEFFREVESSIWTLVILTNGFSKNYWANYCKDTAFYNKIVTNNGDKLIPVIIGDAVKPKELQTNIEIRFPGDSRYWNDEKKFKKFEMLLMNELVSPITSADVVLDLPASQISSAEVTLDTTCSRVKSQPGTNSDASNNNSLNDQLETDSPENQNIVWSERQITTGSQSPSPSSVSFVSLSNDPDLTCDQPPTSQGVQTIAVDYDLTKLDQAAQNFNPNTLKLSGKSISIDSLVNSLSNDHSESTSPKQILSTSDSGCTSGGGMTPAHDISPPSQENLQMEVNSSKSDTWVNNSETAQLDLHNPEWKNTRSKDTRDNQTKTLEDTIGQQLRLKKDETQPKNSINVSTQEREDLVRGERTGPDGCESVFSDDAASDSADLKSVSRLSRWKSTVIVGGSHIIKPIMNGFTRTDSFI